MESSFIAKSVASSSNAMDTYMCINYTIDIFNTETKQFYVC